MFNLENTITKLKDGIEICKKVKEGLYGKDFMFVYPENIVYKFEAYLKLLEGLKKAGLKEALEKEYRIDKLVFYFREIDGRIEFNVSYDDELNSEIYETYSGSWSTQFTELNKSFREIANIACFPLTDKSFENIDFSSNIKFLIKRIETATEMLANPTEEFKWLIHHHIELVEKRIAWYRRYEKTYY